MWFAFVLYDLIVQMIYWTKAYSKQELTSENY